MKGFANGRGKAWFNEGRVVMVVGYTDVKGVGAGPPGELFACVFVLACWTETRALESGFPGFSSSLLESEFKGGEPHG